MEYMLIMAVAITIGLAFKKKMEEFMLKNPNSVINKQLKKLTSSIQEDSSGRYQNFTLR